MTKQQTVWESIVEAMRQPLRDYAAFLQDLAGKHADSLTLFGAITTEAFDASQHTARSVLVVDSVDLAMLRRLSEHGARLGKAAIAAPLVMTPGYIESSLDTFPLELLEIQQKHLVVFGEDAFKDLPFEDTHIRLQCERELKTVLIGMRQGLLAAAGRDKFINALERDVAAGLVRTLRGMLWLKGKKEPLPASSVLQEVEGVVERKLDGIRTALEPNADHEWGQFGLLYRDVEALGEAVNAW